MRSTKYTIAGLLIIALLAVISGCGSSSSSGSGLPAATPTLTGSVFAAPIAGASVVATTVSGTVIAGPVKTGSDGGYKLYFSDSALASDIIISSTSGTFTDEATGAATSAGSLAAYVPAGSRASGSLVHLDPSSSVIHNLVTTHALSMATATTYFTNAFGFTPDTSVALVVPETPLTVSNTSQRRAGLFAAAISKIAHDNGITADKQFDLITAIADDLSDGKLDAKMGASVVPGMPTSPLAAFGNALDSVARTSFTKTYKVEYVPGMMAAVKGKSSFQIKVSKLSDGSAAIGLANSLMLMPVMHMTNGHSHATPADVIIEDGVTPGTYNCTLYYLMSTTMSGMSMGYWELQVMIGDMMSNTTESAFFYPYVGMAMGSETISMTLYGPSDMVSMMTGTDTRTYYLFRNGPVTATTPTLNLFVSRSENVMMDFFPVSNNSVLSAPTGTVTAMTLEASTDADPDPVVKTWVTASDNGSGHWSVTGLTGLASGVTSTVYVRVNVTTNGTDEPKTSDGLVPNMSGTNTYVAFSVKPL